MAHNSDYTSHDYSHIVKQLDRDEIQDNSSIGRIVTALIASFALLSFVFILWYAYNEGKRQGLANLQSPLTSQTTASVPASSLAIPQPMDETISSSDNVAPVANTTPPPSENLNGNVNQFRPSFGNDFTQKASTGNQSEAFLPRDPTQPIPLSSPEKFRKESSIPPPPTFTGEPENQSLAPPQSTEVVEEASLSSVNSIAVTPTKNKEQSQTLATRQTTDPQTTRSSVITNPDTSLSQDYGYVRGGDFANQWRVQLASLRSIEATSALWQEKKQQYPALLSGFRLQIEKVAITNKGDFYRLRFGPFLSRAEASKTCDSLKQQKLDCFIVRPS